MSCSNKGGDKDARMMDVKRSRGRIEMFPSREWKRLSKYVLPPLLVFIIVDRGAVVLAEACGGPTPLSLVCHQKDLELVWLMTRKSQWLI